MASAGFPPTLLVLLVVIIILPLIANAASLEVRKHPHHRRHIKSLLPNGVNQLPLVGGNLLPKIPPPVLPVIGIQQQQQQIPAQPLPTIANQVMSLQQQQQQQKIPAQPLPIIANPVVQQQQQQQQQQIPAQPLPIIANPVVSLQQQQQQQKIPAQPLPIIANPVVVPLQPLVPTQHIPATTTPPPVQQQQASPTVTPLPTRIPRSRRPRAAASRATATAATPQPLPVVASKGIPGAIGAAVNLPSFTGGQGSYPAMAQEFLSAHNQVRAKEGEPPLSWDPEIARFAEQYLNTRRYDCAMKHSGNPIYGESLFKGSGWDWHAADAVNEWANEVSNFDRNTNTCYPGTMCGHYTAIVWKPTTRVGCARMECYAGGTIMSCNYYPAGGPVNPFQH